MQPGEQLVFVGSRPFSARFYSQGAAGQLPMDAVAAAPACRGRARLFLAVEKNRLPALRDTLAGWRLLPLYASRRYVLLQVESGAVAARDDAAREAPAAIAATGLAANPPSPAP